MIKLYSEKKAERILRRYAPQLDAIAEKYAVPAAYIKAILYMEITGIDLFDPLADLLARTNQLPGLGKAKRGGALLEKSDSSTGYGQIFAYVAIDAINLAADSGDASYTELGLPEDHRLDGTAMADLRLVWWRLLRDPVFNFTAVALNLRASALEMTGRIDFASYGAEELKLVLTRYNGNFKEVSPYGEAAYRHCLRYRADES